MKGKKQMKLALLILCTFVVLGSLVYAANFSDIAGHWAETNITTLVDAGVINGYPDGTFKPQGTVTKGEFIKLLIAASLPSWYNVNDYYAGTPAHWALPYASYAETYNVTNYGELTAENLNEPVTRKEMAIWMAKADVTMRGNNFARDSVLSFEDCGELTNEEERWINHTVARGLINGYPDNTFGPDKNMTRAEAATVIFRYTR